MPRPRVVIAAFAAVGALACSDAHAPTVSPDPPDAAGYAAVLGDDTGADANQAASAAQPDERADGSGLAQPDASSVARDGGDASRRKPDAGTDAALSFPACNAPIRGDGPFAISLEQSGTQVYFPRGRAPGAPVLFAFPTAHLGGLVVATASITADRSSTPVTARDPYCGRALSGSLVGPEDGFLGTLTTNTSGPGTDVLTTDTHAVKLCASSQPVPAPTLTLARETQLPTQPIRLVPSVPIDQATLASMRMGNRELVVTTLDGGQLSIMPAQGAFAPGALVLDVSGVRDVLGRTILSSVHVDMPVPKQTLSGLKFDSMPPLGSVATLGGSAHVANGKLVLDRGSLAMLGLGSAPASSKLRIKHRFVCSNGWLSASASVSLVASDGTQVALPTTCDSAESTVALAGPAPYFLAVSASEAESRPCFSPSPPAPGYELETVSFVP